MAYAFALNGNTPVPHVQKTVERDIHWFRQELRKIGVSELHIIWSADENFKEVHPLCLDRYIQHRKHCFHKDALALAHSGR